MEQIGLADKLTHNRLSKSNVSNALLPCGSFGPLVGVTGCAHAGYLGVQALSGMNLPTEALRKTLQCRYSHSLSFARSARCTAPGDLDQASRNRILMPADQFGSSTSSFALAFAGNRRRGYHRNYNLRYLTRTGWTDNTPVTPEESDGRLLSYMEELERRLAAIDSACNGNCSKTCEDSMNGTLDSENSSQMDSTEDCMAICLHECTDRETGDTTDAIGNSTTDGWMPSDDSENLTSTTETATTTYTAMNTSTTMTTTTLPPPPVRIVQPTGDIFNMGDALPQDGFVVGRVEIFFRGEWGTVCQDGFGDREAQIVCNELGLAGTWGRLDPSAQAGSGSA
eukprot:s602_g1.t1